MATETRYAELSREDWQLIHDALGMAVTLYDTVEADGGVPTHAPLYGKRDRLVELAQHCDHLANCEPSGVRGGGQ